MGRFAPIARVLDLVDPARQQLWDVDRRRRAAPPARRRHRGRARARRLVRAGGAGRRAGVLARSLDRPLRYFLAKAAERARAGRGRAHRRDRARARRARAGRASSIPPTRAWCRRITSPRCGSSAAPTPTPIYRRFFDPPRGVLPADLDVIGGRYIGALYSEVRRWLAAQDAARADRRAVLGRDRQRRRVPLPLPRAARPGQSPARLKAFTLDRRRRRAGRPQAREFLRRTGPRAVRRDDRGRRRRRRALARRWP